MKGQSRRGVGSVRWNMYPEDGVIITRMAMSACQIWAWSGPRKTIYMLNKIEFRTEFPESDPGLA